MRSTGWCVTFLGFGCFGRSLTQQAALIIQQVDELNSLPLPMLVTAAAAAAFIFISGLAVCRRREGQVSGNHRKRSVVSAQKRAQQAGDEHESASLESDFKKRA